MNLASIKMSRPEYVFPKDRLNQKAVDCSLGHKYRSFKTGTVRSGRGGFPTVGVGLDTSFWVLLEDGYLYDPFGARRTLPLAAGHPIHIGERAIALNKTLRYYGVNDYTFGDPEPDETEHWNADYACIDGPFDPYGDGTESDYFDREKMWDDVKDFVREFFEFDPSVRIDFDEETGIRLWRPGGQLPPE